jgi:aminopeptidase N
MKTDEPKKILLKDYQPPQFKLLETKLFFDLQEDFCRVRSQLKFEKISPASNLVLDGLGLKLESVELNGNNLSPSDYQITEDSLTILAVPDAFELKISVLIHPKENTALEGLYQAGSNILTQCEAQGFRRITYFPDRPDMMSIFTVTIEADEKKYPLLLSNGDKIAQKKLPNQRHQVTWHDPFKKPCYLFALVAGDFGVIQDDFTTASGKKVNLEIYAAHGMQGRCHYAMESLKKSMRWDEQRFGREYDLATYMIVATDDFNAGAMENKGLNIFNSRLILADGRSATDDDYFNIEAVIAHEYFHNWTGNRVTLRDWFHLSLKEGLTVFRDQEFSMDMSSPSVVRIDNVALLRQKQFSEDAGPNAHPIRPESCFAVDNFFTSTIYEKGSEVIRMMQTMVGRPGFRKGMDLYFERHDGQAVIIEDFAAAIADANNQDWQQFKLWYSQAGTPRVSVKENFTGETFELTLSQSMAEPMHIPLIIGLIDSRGNEMKLECPEITTNSEGQKLIHLKRQQQTFVFKTKERPVLSLNRNFSAPIHLDWQASDEDLLFLLSHDQDDFNRWEAGQKLAIKQLRALIRGEKQVSKSLISALKSVLNSNLDYSLKALIFELPQDSYILQMEAEFNVSAFAQARETLELAIAKNMQAELENIYHEFNGKNLDSKDAKEFGKRRLKNLALKYLSRLPKGDRLAYQQFSQAEIMTDQQAALQSLADLPSDLSEKAFEQFHQQWQTDSLVLNKWFSMQALSGQPGCFAKVKNLWQHADFNRKNPNRVYSLLLRFTDNLVQFHNPEHAGAAYDYVADRIIELDGINPQVATRVAGCFAIWKKLPASQKEKARTALETLMRAKLSKNTYEIVSQTLNANS